MLEKSIEQKLREGIEKLIPHAKCLKLVTPGFTGIPDRLILLPSAGGMVVFAELKKPGKKERRRQIFVQNWLRRLGFTVFSTVDSPEKVQEVIDFCWRDYCVRGRPYMLSKGEKV